MYPDNQDEDDDDYPLTGEDPEFQPAPAGGERLESPQPAGPDASSPPSVDPDRSEDVPLTSEPRHSPKAEERQYAPPDPPERAAEGGAPEPQPQVQSRLALIVFILCFVI